MTQTNNSHDGEEMAAGHHYSTDSRPVVEFLLRLVRLYTYHTPIKKGKYRLYQTALRAVGSPPTSMMTTVKDGRKLIVDLTTGMEETVFFLGEYERPLTEIIGRLIRKGATCLDVGANFGWYTTLMSEKAGPSGEVHSFEPVPNIYAELKRNRELLATRDKVFINNLALGDRADTVHINLFDDLPSGHASLAAKGDESRSSFECRMITLDSYLTENNVGNVDLVKVDIEGAELMFLKGSNKLFEQAVPPVFMAEMALGQTRNFGYLPNDLIDFMRGRADYKFYRVNEAAGRLLPIDGFEPDDIGANVFCIPAAAADEVWAVVNEYLDR